MRLLAPILAILIACSTASAQAVRIRGERTEGTSKITSHGTAWVLRDNLLVTCLHVVDAAETVFAETEDGWIACSVTKTDQESDLALLVPKVKIRLTAVPDGFWHFGSPRGQPIVKMKVGVAKAGVAAIEGFDHGCSGGPIVRNGKLIGICRALRSDGKTVYVDAQTVEDFLGAD